MGVKSKIEDDVVEKNIGLVHACAKRFTNRGLEYDDIFQAGCLGLIKASNMFDEDRGVRFSTYAVPVILGEIKQLFRENGAIKVSRVLKDLSMKINKECERFLVTYGKNPSINELSQILGVDSEMIFDAMESSRLPLSLNMSNGEGEDEIDIPVYFDEEKISLRISLMEALDSLDRIDKYLIILRFFRGKTQSETSSILGVTQVWVSRREKSILRDLRIKLDY